MLLYLAIIVLDFHTNTLEQIKKEYVDTGKVRFVFRDFPFNYPALLGSVWFLDVFLMK